jgi:hypothetical protein
VASTASSRNRVVEEPTADQGATGTAPTDRFDVPTRRGRRTDQHRVVEEPPWQAPFMKISPAWQAPFMKISPGQGAIRVLNP